jgi:DNA-binding transcriptional ArsR family regulator
MTDQLSTTFAALADPTRRQILARLMAGEATVKELAAPHAMSLPSISRHLKVLENAGLISQGKDAQWRPRRLNADRLKQVDEWMRPYRRFFDARLDRLEEQLRREQPTEVHTEQHTEKDMEGIHE